MDESKYLIQPVYTEPVNVWLECLYAFETETISINSLFWSREDLEEFRPEVEAC